MALTIMVSFTITGMAVVDMSTLSRTEATRFEQNHQNQALVESALSSALWRINALPDDTTSFEMNGVLCNYDTTTERLTLGVSRNGQTQVMTTDLREDHHFTHSVSVTDSIQLGVYDMAAEANHGVRADFRFLPTPDMDYFLNNARAVITGSYLWLEDDVHEYIDGPGIYVFLGDHIILEDVDLEDVTLVFTGYDTYFYKDNDISAPEPVAGEDPMPALVFTNEDAVVVFRKEWRKKDDIRGTIFCAGKIIMRHGEFTGPIIARKFYLRRNVDFEDDEHPEYYRWNAGFGSYSDYQWPKHATNTKYFNS